MALILADGVFIALGSAAYPGLVDLWVNSTALYIYRLADFIPAINAVHEHAVRRGHASGTLRLTHMLAAGWTVTAAVLVLNSMILAAAPRSVWHEETRRVGGRKRRVQGFLASIVANAAFGSMLFFSFALVGTHRRALSGTDFDAVILALYFIAEMTMAVGFVGTAIGALMPPPSAPVDPHQEQP